MSKYILCLAVVLCSFTSVNAFAQESVNQDQQLWTVLYEGNWSLAHKMILVRQNSDSPISTSMVYFMKSYANYRAGNTEEAIRDFQNVDRFVF